MSSKFKPLFHQVLVIQGATSEAGSATVRSAAKQGAKIYMIDSNEELLQTLQDEMRNKGYDTAYAVANPAEADQVRFAADQCLATFSMIDTWINIPEQMSVEDKKIFEIRFWSLVNGCQVAIPYLAESGGVLINVAQALDLSSLEAIRGYTEALRKQLKTEQPKIAVSLIHQSDSQSLAQAILEATESPKKEVLNNRSWASSWYFRNAASKGLVASGIGGMAVLGGLTFFFLKKFRIV